MANETSRHNLWLRMIAKYAPEGGRSEMSETKRGGVNKKARWRECAEYIKRGKDLDDAKRLAALDHKAWNTSVWITAFGKMLAGKLEAEGRGGEGDGE